MDISVSFNKAPGQSLGIGFKKMPQPPYCQVYKLVGEGAAGQSGKVQEGDMLLCVNGISVQHQTPDEVRQVLSRYTHDPSIQLELRRRSSPSTKQNGNSNSLFSHHPPSQDQLPNGHLPNNNNNSSSSSTRSPEIPEIMSPSPDTSPTFSTRRRRSPVYSGIHESPMLNVPLLQDPHRQRHSLTTTQSRTPEVTRRINQMSLKPAKSLDLANLPQWRQHVTQQVPLKNLITETDMHDRLHTQGIKVRKRERERERERERGEGGGEEGKGRERETITKPCFTV